MSLSISRFCPRLSFFSVRKPISCLHLKYSSICDQQRFCSTISDSKPENRVENFEDFEEISAADRLFTSVDIDAIVGDDLEKKKLLQVYISELNMQMQTEKLVAPKRLTTEQWQKLIMIKTNEERLSYLNRLYFKENRREVRASLSKEKLAEFRQYEERKNSIPAESSTTSSPLSYSLGQTSLFHRIYNQTLKPRYNFDLMLASWFGPDLIVDCSYEKYMRPSELYGCSRQILYMWSSNRTCRNPFNLIFCNLNPKGKIMKHLTDVFYDIEGDCSMLNLTNKSYTDLYAVEQLVYLTPHCDEELEKYDGNSIYIIGAYVDEKVNKPISLGKAKRDGLRTAKFPLDRNLNWAQGSKLLPINQCLAIMNDLKNGADWEYALRHVAIRKQTFQVFGSNNLSVSHKQAVSYVRESAQRDMLRDLNLRQIYKKKDKDSTDEVD